MMSGIYANVWRPCEGIIFRHDKIRCDDIEREYSLGMGQLFFPFCEIKRSSTNQHYSLLD